MTFSGIAIEIAGGHYIPFFGVFYIDNLSPYIHLGAVSHVDAVVAEEATAKLPVLHDSFVVVHIIGAYGVLIFFTAHMVHVFKHQRHKETGLLKRMLPGRRQRP